MHLILTMHLFVAAPSYAELFPMQGEWIVTSTHDGKPVQHFTQSTKVTIHWNRIANVEKGHSTDILFGDASTVGEHFDFLAVWTKPRKLCIWAYEGIYEVSPNRLRFCLKYYGQGAERDSSKNWKPPVDFVVREGQGYDTWTFERIKK